MAHALGMRATSLAASTALLGLAVVAALTMTIVQRVVQAPAERAFEAYYDAPVEDPPAPRPRTPPPPIRPVDEGVLAPLEPLAPAETTETAVTQTWRPPSPPTITHPHWVRRPSDLSRYYPARALQRGIEGQVVLDCSVSTRGALNCAVASETPANWGFGEAALRISSDYRMVPAMRDGVAVEGRHRMVIPFEVR